MSESKRSGRILYFRRPRRQTQSFLVLVQSSKENACYPFNELDEALDFIDEQEEDLAINCSLFQYVPLEDSTEP